MRVGSSACVCRSDLEKLLFCSVRSDSRRRGGEPVRRLVVVVVVRENAGEGRGI